jgi:hypothetical protein
MTDLLMVIASIIVAPSIMIALRKLLHPKKQIPKRRLESSSDWFLTAPKRLKNRRLVTLLIALTPLCAQAKIGETLPQLVKRFGMYISSSGDDAYTFKPWSAGAVVVSLVNGRSALESYLSASPLVKGEPPNDVVRGILNTTSPHDRWHAVQVPNASYALQNKDNSLTAILHYPIASSTLTWDMDIGYTPAIVALLNSHNVQSAAPQATPEPTTTPNDCLVVATEAFARLNKSATWARIAGFKISKNGSAIGGHAVVFYQPTQASNVWMYDKSGSYDTHTQVHDLSVLTEVMNTLLRRNYTASDASWLDGYVSTDANAATQLQTPEPESQPDEGLKPAKDTPELPVAASPPESTPAAKPEISSATSTLGSIFGLLLMFVIYVIVRDNGIRVWPFALVFEPLWWLLRKR